MKKLFCDICGEEIKENDNFYSFRLDSADDKICVDAHSDCYTRLVYHVKRCIEGEKRTRAKRV